MTSSKQGDLFGGAPAPTPKTSQLPPPSPGEGAGRGEGPSPSSGVTPQKPAPESPEGGAGTLDTQPVLAPDSPKLAPSPKLALDSPKLVPDPPKLAGARLDSGPPSPRSTGPGELFGAAVSGRPAAAQKPAPPTSVPPAQPPRPPDLFGAARPQKGPPEAPLAKTPAWRKPIIAPASEEVPAARAAPKALTVSQLTGQVKNLLEPKFTRVLVRGEISNFRGVNARGHFYFGLKDDRASIDVKLWATQAQRLKFQLKDGLSVTIEGNLDVYEPQGRYSLIVNRIEPEGVGAQALAFEQLKQKLVAEGLIGD